MSVSDSLKFHEKTSSRSCARELDPPESDVRNFLLDDSNFIKYASQHCLGYGSRSLGHRSAALKRMSLLCVLDFQ